MNRYLLLSVLLLIFVIGSVKTQYCGYGCNVDSDCASPCGQCVKGTCSCANNLTACQMREFEFECYDSSTSTCCPQSLSHGSGAICGSGFECCMGYSVMTCANKTSQFCCPFENYETACNNGQTCCGSTYSSVCVSPDTEQCCCGNSQTPFACPSSNTCNCTSNTCVAPTSPVTPARATTAPVQPTAAPSRCSHNPCGTSPCCDDRRAGAQCYNSQYSCMDNGDGTSTLCMNQDSVCNGTCYDPNEYDCSNHKLSAHSKKVRDVRGSQENLMNGNENIDLSNPRIQAKGNNIGATLLKFGLPFTGLIGIALAATYIKRRKQQKKPYTDLNEVQYVEISKGRRASKINSDSTTLLKQSPNVRLRTSQNLVNPASSSPELRLSQTFSL